MENRRYVAIDLKSFYASVECAEKGLDPLNTNLVVADEGRTEKTICLAVSPSLKQYGIPGRARLFEVVQRVREVNADRLQRLRASEKNSKAEFIGESFSDSELKANPALSVSYITAPPRMAYYMEYSSRIYKIYLKYIAPEDIVVYSIDEVFIDVTGYLQIYKMTARELTVTMINDILKTTGITATAGIGTNLYLAKVAMDIVAKKMSPDKNGVRIAELDEMSYRKILWDHRPITDFWRVGRGYAKKLAEHGMYTMGDVARCSEGDENSYRNENLLYKLFGINAELLIDHAWGWEPCTVTEIKAYRPESKSISRGQVLQTPYDREKTRLVVREMTDMLALELVDKGLVTDQLALTLGYDTRNLTDEKISREYKGEVTVDRYGRRIPKHAHGTVNLNKMTSSARMLVNSAMELFDRIADEKLLVRRIAVVANRLEDELTAESENAFEQLDLFSDYSENDEKELNIKQEKNMQQAILKMKKKYGKNAVLRGMNFEEGATAISRNKQIGGHKA
ncbi:MAG: DNA methylase [Oscillospiraceae bacterium]|nr:DNA methylase [Oscillospiraceae bacterium]